MLWFLDICLWYVPALQEFKALNKLCQVGQVLNPKCRLLHKEIKSQLDLFNKNQNADEA